MKYKTKILVLAFASLQGLAFGGGTIEEVPALIEEPKEVMYEKSPYYIGLGLSAMSVKSEDISSNIFKEKSGQDRIGTVSILAGYDLDTYLAVEGRYTVSFVKEHVLEMDNIALYVKPQYPATEELSVYALLGYGNLTLDSTSNSGIDGDKSGFQWGLGVSYAVSEDISLFVEYQALAKDLETDVENKDVDSINVGLTYRF